MSRAGTVVRYGPWVASILVAATLLLRFVALGDRPVMHDESLFAYHAYVFFDTGSYTHQPILHGPTLMLAVGALFAVFGDSITVARAFIAVASLVMLAAALALVPRRYRLWIAPLLITSPVLLYYSRFLRNDILFSAVLMLGMVGFAAALSRRRRPGVRAAGAALGMFMFVALSAIMENAAFVYATGATFLLLWAVLRGLQRVLRRWRLAAASSPASGAAPALRSSSGSGPSPALRSPAVSGSSDGLHSSPGWDSPPALRLSPGSGSSGTLRSSPGSDSPPELRSPHNADSPAQAESLPSSSPRSAARRAGVRNRWIIGAGWTAGLLLGLAYLAFVYGITLGPAFQDEARRAVAGDAPETLRAIYLKKLDLTWSGQAEVTVRLMADSWRNVNESWDYWMGQHRQHRIAGPPHYYLPILLTYELPMCLLLVAGLAWDACRRDARLRDAFFRGRRAAVYGAAGASWVALWLLWKGVSANFAPAWLVALEEFLHLAPDASALALGLVITPVLAWSILSLRERRVLAAWMGWWLACSLFQYAVAGEKVPWLAVHMTLPLYLTVVWLWAPRLRRLGRKGNGVAVGATGIVAPFLVAGSSLLALRDDIPLIGDRAADPAERIVYNHTTPWLHRALESRLALWKTMQDTVPLKARRVVLVGHGVWPAVWYLRHLGYQIVEDNQKILSVPEGTDLVVGTPEQLAPLLEGAQAGRYAAHAGSLRDGWIETWPDAGPLSGSGSSAAKLWRYYWSRELWTPRSTFPILLVEPVPPLLPRPRTVTWPMRTGAGSGR